MLSQILSVGKYRAEKQDTGEYRLYLPAQPETLADKPGLLEVKTLSDLYKLVNIIPKGSVVEELPEHKIIVPETPKQEHYLPWLKYGPQFRKDLDTEPPKLPEKKTKKRNLLKDVEVRFRAWKIKQTTKKKDKNKK